MKRNVYLKTVPLDEALHLFNEHITKLVNHLTEKIPVENAFGRITASPVFAIYSNPNYNAAAMDGIMVNSIKTIGADERTPVKLSRVNDYVFVDTGDVIMPPYDSVIMIEDVEIIDENHINIRNASFPWQHIRMIGEDFTVGEMLLTSHHKITGPDLGAMISGGIEHVEVFKPLKIGLIPTGTEIVEIGSTMNPGCILESNTRMFAGLVLEAGGIPNRYPIVIDDREKIKNALLHAVSENDLVVINAGSSAGSEDYTSSIIQELGEVWVHGIDIKPGKPTILGTINNKPVVGIPGYPVSAYMAFKHFVTPVIQKYHQIVPLPSQQVTLSKTVVSSLKHQEFVRVQVGIVDGKTIATPLTRGAGATLSLVKSNGILTVPKSYEGYQAGETVEVQFTRDDLNLENGIVSIGSHDLIMDWIRDLFAQSAQPHYLMSAHVGSLGGIMAIKRGEAHIAPIHLLDELTGIYNTSFIEKYLRDDPMILVKGIKRWQGFYTRKNEPLIQSFEEIKIRNLTFINRQKGSGTRLLTDFLVQRSTIEAIGLKGYETEVNTHTGVALAVLCGNADVGVGIESVAHQMGLNYSPIGKEDYDFLIPKKLIHTSQIQSFLDLINGDAFISKIKAAGGYEIEPYTFVEIGR